MVNSKKRLDKIFEPLFNFLPGSMAFSIPTTIEVVDEEDCIMEVANIPIKSPATGFYNHSTTQTVQLRA